MTDTKTTPDKTEAVTDDAVVPMRQRLGKLDPRQVDVWRAKTPVQRLDLAFQAYQFALDAVRTTEKQRHPYLSPEELAWRVTRRMQGDQKLGR